MASVGLLVGGFVMAIISAIGALVTNEVVSSAGFADNALFGLFPTLFAVAGIMGLIIAGFGMFIS